MKYSALKDALGINWAVVYGKTMCFPAGGCLQAKVEDTGPFVDRGRPHHEFHHDELNSC